MAVQAIPQSLALTIKVQSGVSPTGNPTFKTRKYSNIKINAPDADIFAIGNAISSLQKFPINSLLKTLTSDLVEV